MRRQPRAAAGGSGPSRGGPEDGFTVLESTIALGLVFLVLLGLLSTMAAGARGITLGRQRTLAVGIANEVMEQARGMAYAAVGHDLDDDAGLAVDPALTSTGTFRWTYQPEGGTAEPLVASNQDQPAASPFFPHRWQRQASGGTFSVSTYVTLHEALGSGPVKRVTVVVAWDEGQYGSGAVADEVRLSSLLFDAAEPPDPLLQGLSDVGSGYVRVTGHLADLDLAEATFSFPYSHGEIDSRFIRRLTAVAGGARGKLALAAPAEDAATGCAVTADGSAAECAGLKAETVADNDAGSGPDPSDVVGPLYDGGWQVAEAPSLRVASGGSEVASKSTVAACFACVPSATFSQDDGLPLTESSGRGPGGATVDYVAGALAGVLVDVADGGAATSTVDRNDAITGSDVSPTVRVTSRVTVPALTFLTFGASGVAGTDGAPLPWAGMVRTEAVTATAEATAGPGATPPQVVGGVLTVDVFGTAAAPGAYERVSAPVGTEWTRTGHADLVVDGHAVTVDATVSAAAPVSSARVVGTTVDEAEASLTAPLRVETRIQVVAPDGVLLADLLVEGEYGRLLSRARYELVT